MRTFALMMFLAFFSSLTFASTIGGEELIAIESFDNSRLLKIRIDDNLKKPLSIFIFDKKGNQLKYKYWESDHNHIVTLQLPAVEKNAYVLEVIEDGKTIFKKTVKINEP